MFTSKIPLHRSMRNAVLVKDLAMGRKTELDVEAKRMGLGMKFCLTKAAFLKASERRFDQCCADREPACFFQHGYALDLADPVVNPPQPERANGLSIEDGKQMFSILVQPIEFQRQINLLLVNEHGLPNGEG